MKPYAEVIGDPIAQSKSPAIHGHWLAALGIDADYGRAHVLAADLADYLARRRADPAWRGCNVTMPHKQAIIPLLDALDPLAQSVGAVNTVVPEAGRLVGYNTDVAGFLEPLGRVPDRVGVIGAGGAARAILAGLAQGGARQVVVQNRDVAKAQALLAEFGLSGQAQPLGEAMPVVDLLVNTSSLGMAGQPPAPAAEAYVAKGGTVFDIVTHPLDTALLQRARARDLRTIDGLAMLIGQADHAFRRFFGAVPDRADGDVALRALLMAPA